MKRPNKVIAKTSTKRHKRFPFYDRSAAQIDVEEAPRCYVATSQELLQECAGLFGGEIAARRSVQWILDHDLEGSSELVASA